MNFNAQKKTQMSINNSKNINCLSVCLQKTNNIIIVKPTLKAFHSESKNKRIHTLLVFYKVFYLSNYTNSVEKY